MFSLGLAEILLIALIVVPCVAWARIDAKQQRYHPVIRGMTVGIALVAIFVAFFIVVFVQSKLRGEAYEFVFAWDTFLFASVAMLMIASLLGWFSYLVSHFFADKEVGVTDQDRETPIHLEETGNPYQPPST